MSDYKYLVLNLKYTSSNSHLNIFTTPNIWGPCHSTAAFNNKKQIVVDLQNATYTNDGDMKGQPLDAKNVYIVSLWGNGQQSIVVNDIYLTNNDDYSSGLNDPHFELNLEGNTLYDLQGRLIGNGKDEMLPLQRGIYIRNGRKIVVR
jgi:hypothetical protein